jgi:hypothetical protein
MFDDMAARGDTPWAVWQTGPSMRPPTLGEKGDGPVRGGSASRESRERLAP